ncbi:flavohemoglobin expression-modulating QEGLA motif protein [Aquimarina sp. 2201CG14-23]|uniref:flavohemoglobin expression-modulating QEGLA motif protein n=1 Tax=Aquimarina mycalae TaxID=3040073 RepID=UPI002477FB53|nr:flavohemoglobin expression-modulating QEGLA motif protein [Aquimarina sp. 2201CG14-23]MDH7445611.1 flavohemoglobin expression-modulating QEGLA motif protein [Aquimarina sp. 2201CG14-23]
MIEDVVDTYTDLFEIDQNLDRLVKNIELLNYLNPLNIELEKKNFFASKYRFNPKFKYKKIKFNPYKLQRLFFSQRLERIEDEEIRKLYQDIIYEYSGLIQCIETIGNGKSFYYNSLKVFGTPKERDVENARFILHFEDEQPGQELEKKNTANDAEEYFREFAKRYDFNFHIKKSTNISASAMVLNASETLVLKKNYKFSDNELQVLANHEIGVHMVTTFNGKKQPLKIFSNGFVNNTETQEGLAVFSEYMSGCLTLKRMKELAYRVIAADSLIKGYDFKDTFDLLYSQYKLDRDAAWQITLRVHRGGGFTKDYLYLTGLKKIYDYYHSNQDMSTLLTGKVTLENKKSIDRLQQLALANTGEYMTDSFAQNLNTNTKLDFILSNLK